MVPAGTVIGTPTDEPELVTVTTPFVSLAEIEADVLARAVAHALCSARTWASETSVIWSIGAELLNQLLYWLSMLLIRSRIV